MLQYKVGDRVRIVDNLHNHQFSIGEVVELVNYSTQPDETDVPWTGQSARDYWYLSDEEFEPEAGLPGTSLEDIEDVLRAHLEPEVIDYNTDDVEITQQSITQCAKAIAELFKR